MAEKIRIKIITGRNFTFGQALFGKGGEYSVDEATARELRRQGKAIVIEGYVPEEPEDLIGKAKKQEFLKLVESHAGEILDILKNHDMRTRLVEMPRNEEDEAVESSSETETAPADVTEETAPEADPSTGTAIPDGFPGKAVLEKNGITTIEEIPTTKEDLMALDQMTGRIANQIGVKLSKED